MASPASLVPQGPPLLRRSRLPRWRLIALASVLLLGGQGLVAWREDHMVLINQTTSLPNWAFFVTRETEIRRGDLLVFAPPRSALVVAHFGEEPAPFTKIAYGVPGDLVSHDGNAVRVNGSFVGRMKPVSLRGEMLNPGPVGRIPPGCYYAGTPHKDGFDSRYAAIGFVCANAVIGTAEPVL